MSAHDGKTEKPTPRRQREARREGKVARSTEIGVAASLLVTALVLHLLTPAAATLLRRETVALLHGAGQARVPNGDLAQTALRIFAATAGPIVGVASVVALIAGLAQTRARLAPKALRPKLSHLSPKRGLARLKPGRAGWELLRTFGKLGLLVAVAWQPVALAAANPTMGTALGAGLSDTMDRTWTVLLRTILLATVIAAADYAWNRRQVGRELRMTMHEVRREHKDEEGDPLVRAQRRRRQAEMSRNRGLHDVPLADVVVTNPTHLAVALRYERGDPAPRVLAKGADVLAAKIRRAARTHGVPVIEDVALARALHRRCGVGQVIPAALYEAVAVVLALAYRRRGLVTA